MTATFDPWKLEAGPSQDNPAKWSESLTARARKRKVNTQGNGWSVSALSGELMDRYYVTYSDETRKYECECYHTNHGDTRRRRMCSHVLAVILHRQGHRGEQETQETRSRKNHNEFTGSGNGANDTQKGGDTLQLALNGKDGGRSESQSEPIGPPQSEPGPSPATIPFNNTVPKVDDPMWGGKLPGWVEEIRPHQWDAVQAILQAYDEGAKVVWLDAPTGSGKTLIAELVRRLLKVKGLYVCSGKTLQHQFCRDFPEAKLLMGRSNYPTELMPEPYTCADCTAPDCAWCDEMSSCPYQIAKKEAIKGPLSVLNTAYFLAEGNYVGDVISKASFVVLDECDVLERELMGFVEFRLGPRVLKDLKLEAPKKGSHKGTIQEWMEGELVQGINDANRNMPRGMDELEKLRYRKKLGELRQKAAMVVGQIHKDEWIRDNDAGPLVMKPVKVSEYGQEYLWRHGERWLCMSATIISADELCDSLGLDPRECQVVRVPMTFDVENRRVNVAPVANMVAKEKDTTWPQMATGIRRVMGLHPGERILVHTVSYDLARYLHSALRDTRRAITYLNSQDRDGVLAQFRATEGAVLLASSLDRGVDLRGDECRVVVVAKMPYPYLGDKQVSARTHMQNGQAWYVVQTIRSLVQMTGRAVRSQDDWAVSYILDKQFVSNLYKRNKALFPRWWIESLDMGFNVRTLL